MHFIINSAVEDFISEWSSFSQSCLTLNHKLLLFLKISAGITKIAFLHVSPQLFILFFENSRIYHKIVVHFIRKLNFIIHEFTLNTSITFYLVHFLFFKFGNTNLKQWFRDYKMESVKFNFHWNSKTRTKQWFLKL